MPIDLRKALNTDDPKWEKFKSTYKNIETKTWRALDPVGEWTNRKAGKFGAESFWPTELPLEINKAARILRTFTFSGAEIEVDSSNNAQLQDQAAVLPSPIVNSKKQKDPHKYDSRKTQKVVRKISPKILARAQGLAIFTVFRTGFGFSGASGSGVVLSRLPDGSWSAPTGILVHTIGWGLLIGADIYDVVLVLRNQKAVDAFKKPKISLGGEFSIAAGPVGNGAMLDSGVEGAPCWSYTKSKGLYAGLQLDGNIILKRDDANARFYGTPGITANDILSGNLRGLAPQSCVPLWQTIYAAEGRSQLMGVDQIPQGTTPGDLVLSEQDMKDASVYAEEDMKRYDGHSDIPPQGTGASSGSFYAVANAQPDNNVPPQATGASSSGTIYTNVSARPDRRVPPPPTAPINTAVAGEASFSDLPPDYDFANTPVNAQGGKTFNDAPSEHPNHPAAALRDDAPAPYNPFAESSAANPHPPESAEWEKERLRQHYASEEQTSASAQSSAAAVLPTSSGPSGATPNLPSQVEALHDFDAVEAGDLMFKAGDVIEITGQEDEMWWRGKVGGREGIFPSNYAHPL